jgi:NCS1 family nucleobase:cation symporter-1
MEKKLSKNKLNKSLQEEYEITPIERPKRIFKFTDLFSIWFGAGISIAEFWAGALLTPALALYKVILLIILGHIIGNFIMGLISIEGEKVGVPTMVLTRVSLGIKGSILPSILNYLQLIGWTAIMLIIGASAVKIIFPHSFLGNYYLWIVILGVLVTLWTYIGPKNWGGIEKISAVLLLLLSIWLTYITLNKFPLKALMSKSGTGAMGAMLGLDLVIAMPISWAPVIADYSRFSKGRGGAFWGTFIGYFFSSSLFYFVGALTNMAAGKADPIAIIAFYAIGIPAMLVIVFSTATTTFLDVYSAAVSFQNILPKASAKKQILLVGMLGTLIALVFPIAKYESFLLLLGGAFVSLTGIMITDYFLVKKRLDEKEIFNERGAYWYKNGYNIRAIFVWAMGFLFYIALAVEGLFGVHIPVLSEFGTRFGSSIPTLILVGLLYYVMEAKSSKGGKK